jgi:hypothetical protein
MSLASFLTLLWEGKQSLGMQVKMEMTVPLLTHRVLVDAVSSQDQPWTILSSINQRRFSEPSERAVTAKP